MHTISTLFAVLSVFGAGYALNGCAYDDSRLFTEIDATLVLDAVKNADPEALFCNVPRNGGQFLGNPIQIGEGEGARVCLLNNDQINTVDAFNKDVVKGLLFNIETCCTVRTPDDNAFCYPVFAELLPEGSGINIFVDLIPAREGGCS
ncbi:hypothetical protein H2200_011129 [Cladophialophora chaetospira]|uniref:Uncharacterized protein n=1 Tax=Cladophialophora chaetospira TaxID=386627 RepID=A0AA39CDG5_9EURO|nr:hypothetical protein H2200_011129 [Cladophialophora chaetospira]